MVACLLAAAAVAYLLWPGVLIYPSAEVQLRSLVTLQVEANATLEARVEQLRVTLGENTCLPTEVDGEVSRMSLPPVTAGPGERAQLPNLSRDGPANPDATTESLIERLDRATVLVFWQTENKFGHGSGFFVAPGLVVTNGHVLGTPPASDVYISSRTLGRRTPAEVVVYSDDVGFGTPDFAVLRAAESTATGILPLTRNVERLQSVIAAGFPGFVMDSDGDFQRLLEGDAGAVPLPATSHGEVTALQEGFGQIPVILHSATIARGNSGGPLTDECGRLIGLNTYVRLDEQDGARMNFALGTDALLAFLDQHGLPRPPVDDAVCDPSAAGSGDNR